MSNFGTAAIETLARAASEADAGASSHWRHQHETFRFTGYGFEGLRGFGGATPRRPHRVLGHRFFQRPFRAMAAGMPAFPEIDALAHQVCAAQNRNYDLHVLRNALTVAFLRRVVPERLAGAGTACIIGDGFGSMAALLIGSRAVQRVILVNLTRTLLVDLWYLRMWMGDARFDPSVVLVDNAAGLAAALASQPGAGEVSVIALQAQHHALLQQCPLDLTVNMASMGEMDPGVIAEYFADLRTAAAIRPSGLVFYCCNREEKRLPDGTVTRFADYPWDTADQILVDERCPWHQRYYSTRPPFYHPYDGPVRHRLANLAPLNRAS